jgi:5-methylthioadenosine/S-adenosylhomocysteine deaminase
MDGDARQPLGEVRTGSIRFRGDRIDEIGPLEPEPGENVVDGGGCVAIPGFVQGHVHATQTLFRGLACDLPLLPWLRQRIWPLEHAHDADSTAVSAQLTFAELLAGGTTTVQTMESVRHTEDTCREALAAGLTAIVGNCLMDVGDGAPEGLATSAREALARTEALCAEFHGEAGRLWIAVAPRFVLSCTEGLARDAAALAAQRGLRVHTHAAEHRDEIAAVRARFGAPYLEVLLAQGLLGGTTSLAHCVHTEPRERELMAETGTAVLHCPSANLKLGSGIAPIAAYRQLGLRVALGADGAPCNNRLSMLTELRQAALLQALTAGPGAFGAEQALWTATAGGAEALNLQTEVGALRQGLRADVVLLDLGGPFTGAASEGPARIAAAIVYAASEQCIRHVICGGEFAVRDGELQRFDRRALADAARALLPRVLQRAGLAR